MKLEELEELKKFPLLHLNYLARIPDVRRVFKICKLFPEKVPEKYTPKTYTLLSRSHRIWIKRVLKWFEELRTEFKHHHLKDTILHQIELVDKSINENKPLKETFHLYEELRLIVSLTRHGHHPTREASGTIRCIDCNKTFSEIEDIESCHHQPNPAAQVHRLEGEMAA